MRCTSSVSAPISLRDFLGIPGRLVSSTQQTITTTSTSRASTSTGTRNVLKYRSSRPTSTSTCTSHAIVQVPVPVLRVHVPVRVPVLHRPVCHRTSWGFQADSYQVLNIQVPVAVQEDSCVQVLCMVLLAAMPCSARRGGRRSAVQSVSHVAATAALPWRRDALCVDKGEEETRASEPASGVTAGTNSDGQ